MLDLSFLQIEQMVGDFLLPFFRIAAFMMAMPILSTQYVPTNVRLSLAIAFSIAIVPSLPAIPVLDGLSLATYLLVAEQMLIGAAIGFSLHLMFQIFAIGGQLIANQMGLGFASVNDPANGVSIVVVGQYYMMLAMMLFITMNGHLIMFHTLADSFKVLPVGLPALENIKLMDIVYAGGWMFQAGVLMSLPAVTSLLIVNVAFGVMSKASPQLNIIAIGFPFTMTLGIFITWISFSGFLGQFEKFSEYGLAFAGQLLRTQ